MASSSSNQVHIICYWGGNMIKDSEHGLSYDIPPNRAIILQYGNTFQVLVRKLYKYMQLNVEKHSLKMTCRYPIIFGERGEKKFIPIPIDDDEGVQVMFDIPKKNPGLNSAELYVDVIPNESVSQPSNNFGDYGTYLDTLTNSYSTPSLNLPTSPNYNIGICPSHMDVPESSNVNLNIFPDTVENENCVDKPLHHRDEDDIETEEEILLAKDNKELVEGNRCRHEAGETSSLQQVHEPAASFFTSTAHFEEAVVYNIPRSLELRRRGDHSAEFAKGNVFIDKKELQQAVKMYSVSTNHQYQVVETNARLWLVKCRRAIDSGCTWRLRACKKKKSGLFQITKYNGAHSCLNSDKTQDHKNIDSKTIASLIQNLVKTDPTIKISKIITSITEMLQCTISYKKAWHAKQKAIAMVHGYSV